MLDIPKGISYQRYSQEDRIYILMLIVIRTGSQLPTPGVDSNYIQQFFAQNTGEAFNLFNAFTVAV